MGLKNHCKDKGKRYRTCAGKADLDTEGKRLYAKNLYRDLRLELQSLERYLLSGGLPHVQAARILYRAIRHR